jgi:glucose/arabinose dehydrogenase
MASPFSRSLPSIKWATNLSVCAAAPRGAALGQRAVSMRNLQPLQGRPFAAVATVISVMLTSLLAVSPATPAAAEAVSFSDTIVAKLAAPTAVAWTPDGRMLVAQDVGQLRVVRDGQLLATPALNLGSRVCSGGERGLLGVAVDPNFATNRFVYLYWTHNVHQYCGQEGSNTPENRVTRYVLGDNDRISLSSEKVLVDHISAQRLNHNAGDLNFGADGFLYVSVGDGGCVLSNPTLCGPLNTNSRRLDIPHGKILRVTRAGGVPSSNPYVGVSGARRCTLPTGPQPGGGPCTETFASGFRNPFRFAQVPGTSNFYVNDVGQEHWEEIDLLRRGADYGWNTREGHCATGSATNCGSTSYTNPIHDYSHSATGCGSITGGAFVPEGLWPAPYGGSYLFGDYVCGKIFRLVPQAGGGYTQEEFLTGLGAPVHLEFGPYGSTRALYYLDYLDGAVHRVTPAAANTAPVADFWQRPDGLTVTLDGSASHDPDSGDSIASYHWDFGDGTSATTTTPRTTHTYPRTQTYAATLTVTDTRGATSAPFSKDVLAGEHAPSISITSPATTARFSVNKQVTVTASATDQEDGFLAGSAISWNVTLVHGSHTHPYAGPFSGSIINVTYPAPEDLAATGNSYLRVTAVATDSVGLTSRTDRSLLPRKVTVTLNSTPTGARLQVNGTDRIAPASVVSWAGYTLRLNAPNQTINGKSHIWSSWSDGGPQTHSVVTPTSAKTYTAVFASN